MRRTFTPFTLNPYGFYALTFLLFLLSTVVGYSQGFDLALKKELSTDPIANPIYPGDTVSFTITLYNQGTFDADSVEVTDYEIGVNLTYFPIGDQTIMSALGNSIEVTDVGDGTYTLLDFPAGDTLSFTVRQQVNILYSRTNMNNFAEISYAEYTDGTVQTDDIDSQADSDDRNTVGEQFSGNAVDDEIDQDGLNGGDEDDHDVARFDITQRYDLALTKALITPDPVNSGDNVEFEITIYNQGTLIADTVEVTDYYYTDDRTIYIPVGEQNITTSLGNTITVSDLGDGVFKFYDLAPGDTVTFSVLQQIAPENMRTIIRNWAEISQSYFILNGNVITGDEDSTPDNDNRSSDGELRSEFAVNNETDQDGLNGGDEDDHDWARVQVNQTNDLALRKELFTDPMVDPIYPGDTVEFTITIFNQGTLDADSVSVTDYGVAPNLTYISSGDQLITTSLGDTVTVFDRGGGLYEFVDLLAGDTLSFTVRQQVSDTYARTNMNNFAEISRSVFTFNNTQVNGDEDSVPDSQDRNTDGEVYSISAVDDEVDENGLNGGDEDDHDVARFPVMQGFDLALRKELLTDPIADPIYPGDTVDFTITLFNQGTLLADSIIVTDYQRANITYVPIGNQNATSSLGDLHSIEDRGDGSYLVTNLAIGDTLSFTVRQEVAIGYPRTNMNNFAEISRSVYTLNGSFMYDDADSYPDNQDRNTDGEVFSASAIDDEINGDWKGTEGLTEDQWEDEDDHDVARFPVMQGFDLALRKELLTDPMVDPIYPGDTVDFTITIFNQGTLPADTVEVTDYEIGVNLTYASIGNQTVTTSLGNSVEVVDEGDGSYTFTDLAIGDTVSFIVKQIVAEDYARTNMNNFAEISRSVYTLDGSLMYDDVDSYPDGLDRNTDGEKYSEAAVDDEISGDWKNGGEDEDDHDVARFMVMQEFDLALRKELLTDPMVDPINPGDTVDFTITVFNQGTLMADSVIVTDYELNMGRLEYASIGSQNYISALGQSINVVDQGDGTYLFEDFLPGDTLMFTVQQRVGPDFMGIRLSNRAEISYSVYTLNGELMYDDTDSYPDDINHNTPGEQFGPGNPASDDEVDENGKIGEDEDDHDREIFRVEQIFDISLEKSLVTEDLIYPGDTVVFGISLVNEGTLSADSITVEELFNADSLLYVMIGDSVNTSKNGVVSTITDLGAGVYGVDTLAAGDTLEFLLQMEVPSDFMELTNRNIAYVSNSSNVLDEEDINPDNESDTVLFDIEQIFDIALRKEINTTESPGPYTWGDTLTFSFTIFNEGTLSADSIVLRDSLPMDLYVDSILHFVSIETPLSNSFENSTPISVVDLGNGEFGIDTLPAMDSVTFDLRFRIDEDFRGLEAINRSELIYSSNILGQLDFDSTPNDLEGDDYDSVLIALEPRFDLALEKSIVDTLSSPLSYGDTLVFELTVYNEGNVPATEYDLTDSIPSGMAYLPVNTDSNWIYNSVDAATMSITQALNPYEDTTVQLQLVLVQNFELDAYLNIAEISAATNDFSEDDEDSTPGNGDREEDDLGIQLIEISDLALRKVLSSTTPGPFGYGDTLAMEIELYNQGNVPVDSIEITDYLPEGLNFIDDVALNPGWDGTDPLNPVYVWSGDTLYQTDSDTITLYVGLEMVDMPDSSSWTNYSEISYARDTSGVELEDIDSETDNDPLNDIGGTPNSDEDDHTADDGIDTNQDGITDEDDMDPLYIQVYDLALQKTINPGFVAPYRYGDTITLDILVVNQGNEPANTIEITDYIPDGLEFAPGKNTDWDTTGAYPVYTIGDTLSSGEDTLVGLEVVVIHGTSMESWTNYAEISSALNRDGDPFEDIDSELDGDVNNDYGAIPEGETDDALSGDGSKSDAATGEDETEFDEDDHDVAKVRVVDLALYKQVDTSLSIFPEMFGSQVKFDIIVVNQGNVPSDSVVIEDYLPEGYGFDPMDASNIAEGWGSDLTVAQEGRLQFGESDTVCLYTTLENVIVPMEATWWNYAEITEVYDTTGLAIGGDDMDSEPGSDSEEERSVSLESEGDDDITSTGRDDVGSDDDHDVAGVRFLDLALYKQVDSIETSFPVAYGDLIKFDLIAVSQEGVTVDSIRVRDYIPEGYSFDPNIPENASLNWHADTTAVVVGPFAVGDTMHTSIYLTLEQISVPTDRSWVNYSEIANAWMGDMDIAGMDIDSEPDSDSPEEREIYPGLEGDDDIESITRDGIGSEDDHDPAHVEVFDLALRKTTNATVGKVGDDITFTIDIYNQGSIAATDIEISDYVNDGYSFNGFLNSGWQNTNNTVSMVLEDTLYAGESTSVQLVLTVTNEYDPEAMINRAEVSMAADTSGMEREDIDGMFDQDQFNDAGGLSESPADDYVDGDGTGNINDGDAQGDEDNADPEYVVPCPPVNCYGSLFLSFDMNCEIVVTPDMLLIENGLARKNPEFYEVVLTYGNGIVIPNNTLYKNHVGKDITARITFLLDECGGGACETSINIEKPDGCLIGNTLDTIVYCIDPFLELDPEDDEYPKPEAMQPCEEDPLTVRPGVDWVDTDFDCTSDTVKVIYREWMAETRSGERCTASDTIVVLRLPALTGNEFVEMKEDSFYCELTPMPMMDPYSVDYNAWKQPIGIHDYEQPGSGLRGVIYDLPVLVLETALAGAQALDLEEEYLDQEILRKKNGVVYKVEDFMPGGDYYSVLEHLGGERGQILTLHRGPFNFVDYPFIVLELGDWILGSGGYFEQVTEEWFYSGNGNSPFWFAGAWPFISGGGECVQYMDYSEAEGEKCLAHIQLPAIQVIDGELVYNTEECVELCLKEGIHCGLAIEGADFGAWEGQCPQTRGRNVTVTQTCWSDAPNCDAGIYQDGENENAAVTSVDSTGKRIVIELEKWQTIIDTIGPIFEYCYDVESDQNAIQSDIRLGVIPELADEWERTHFTTYNTGSHDCTAEVYVPKVVLKDICSGIHHVKATVNGKSVLLQGGIPDENGYRVFNHITDPIEVPFEGADAPLREIVYEAVDSCWNVSTWSKYLKVKDETVPHVVTDDAIRVSLNHKEEWIAAEVFGEGSYDNCGIELELARRTDWWQDPKCVNLCPEDETFGNWADILVAIGFDRGDVNVILSGGTLNGTYDLDLERLKENILSDTKIEEHYFKSIAWLWEDSDCGEKVVHGWLYEIAKVLSDPAYCGLTDEHGNALNEEVLREFFDRLTGVPGYGKEIAFLGGGWSTDVPFKCEDACQAVTVEYLAVDYWCNWSKGWLPVEVEDKSKGEVARELEDLSITCESYSVNYEDIVLAALEAGNSSNNPEVFASLDSIWGSYIPTWLDNRGRAVDAEGNLLSDEMLTFGYTNLRCDEKSETIKIADTLHDGTIDWIQRVEKIATLEEEAEIGYHGIIGILCSGEVEQDVWVDLDECNQGVITRRFRIQSCSDKSPVLELEQKIYIESACGLRKSMFHVPESLEKEGVCIASLEYDGKGNVVLPGETGNLTLRENLDGVLCNGITVRYEDEVYKIAEVSDQYKVERHWTVADWCTHEELTFVQVIKVNEDPECAPVVDTTGQSEVYSIVGEIYTEAEEMLSNVSVTARLADGSPVTTRTQSGEYTFNMQEGRKVDILPYKNDGHREGLSTLDVVEIWQHVMGRQELEGWTSQTAADVDHNGTIDLRDVMELRELVLTPGAKLANSPSWRFVHRETDREYYRIDNLSKDMEIDFMGVKIGDVNTGADPSRRKNRSGLGVLALQAGDRYLEAGGKYRIEVTSSNYTAIKGGQISLEYLSQWMEVTSIKSGALQIGKNGQVNVRPGLLHMNWINGSAQSLGKEEVLFTMEVEAKADGWLRDLMHIDNNSIPSEAYGVDRNLKNIGLHFTNASTGYALYQNAPNPFEGETIIGFQIPKKDQVTLTIYDVTGRLIKVVEGEYESGHHKIRLRLDEMSAGGVMYYQFRSGDYTETKQMILIR